MTDSYGVPLAADTTNRPAGNRNVIDIDFFDTFSFQTNDIDHLPRNSNNSRVRKVIAVYSTPLAQNVPTIL